MKTRLLRTLLQTEGPRAILERAADRAREWIARRRYRPVEGVTEPVPVLHLLATPLSARLGGVQIQLARRLDEETRTRAVALACRETGGLRVDVRAGNDRRFFRIETADLGAAGRLRDPAFEHAVRQALRRAGSGSLHVENAAGFPVESLAVLAEEIPTILSLHDWFPFCARTDLLEHPGLRYCGEGADEARCARCLADGSPIPPASVGAHRRAGESLFRAVRAAIFPSEILRSTMLRLFPALDAARAEVVPPDPPSAFPPRSPRPVRRVAFVGSVTRQKGSREFSEVVRTLAPRLPVRWSAYGKGDPEELRSLRALPVRVAGYYRAGTLGRRLRRDRVDLALALSITPEAYGLAVDECLAARVPVLAFRIGAPAERLAEGRGTLVDPPGSARAVANAIEALVGAPDAPLAVPIAAPAVGASARIAEIYRRIGVPSGARDASSVS